MKASCLFVTLFSLGIPAMSAFAQASLPDCLGSDGQALAVINDEVLNWETSTRDEYLTRAHIQGTFVRSYANESGHRHFAVQIGATPEDAVEIVYNDSFGALPAMNIGDQIEVCGDYITSIGGPGDSYPVSPDKAILHWVHKSDSRNHKSGYVAVGGQIYGQGRGHGA